ncbi:MAG: CPBP family intramembrane metalloprotease [Lachnospiraceae bacterium]|nr:CPBP family intramembrane metalloprotease [Lachnospiraceae bacterium]
MNLIVQYSINSIIQIILFSLIPIIWWAIKYRKETGFGKWIGLKKVENAKENHLIWAMIGVLVPFLVLSVYMLFSIRGVETATSDFAGLGCKAIPAILIYAIFNTSFPEEIIFRGFLLKRLSNKFGFTAGNIIQSVLFGMMHGIMFYNYVGMVKTVIIIVFTGAIGWFMGFLNEKRAGGSILPSWAIHAIANIFSGLCSAFVIFG